MESDTHTEIIDCFQKAAQLFTLSLLAADDDKPDVAGWLHDMAAAQMERGRQLQQERAAGEEVVQPELPY